MPDNTIDNVIMIPPAMTFQENASILNIMLVSVAITAAIGISTAQVTAETFLIEIVLITQHAAVHKTPKNTNIMRFENDHEKYIGLSNGNAYAKLIIVNMMS